MKAPRPTLTAAAALLLLSRGQKVEAGALLKAIGLDWASLNPYAVGLFGVPVMAALCLWTLWWARGFAETQGSGRWYEKVATKTELGASGRGRFLATWSLLCFVVIPVAVLASLMGKFLNGTYYFSETGEYTCTAKQDMQGCICEGAGMAHFAPSHGMFHIQDAPYRYDGDLTYLPPWEGLILVRLCLALLVYLVSYIRLLVSDPHRT